MIVVTNMESRITDINRVIERHNKIVDEIAQLRIKVTQLSAKINKIGYLGPVKKNNSWIILDSTIWLPPQ